MRHAAAAARSPEPTWRSPVWPAWRSMTRRYDSPRRSRLVYYTAPSGRRTAAYVRARGGLGAPTCTACEAYLRRRRWDSGNGAPPRPGDWWAFALCGRTRRGREGIGNVVNLRV